MDFLNYIKSLFSFSTYEPPRKRRYIDEFDDFDVFTSPKFRRIHNPMSRQMDDIIISPDAVRRPARSRCNAVPKEIIVLDDEDPRKEKKPKIKFTSTPEEPRERVSLRDDDDIKFVREFKASTIRKSQPRSAFPFLKPFSLIQNIPDKTNGHHSLRESSKSKPLLNGSNGSKLPRMSTYTNRLDDKKEFQHLLESHLSRENSLNNGSQYFTPNSRLSRYNLSDRTKRIMDLSRQSSGIYYSGSPIDLTNEEMNGSGKMTVKDKIKKVLDSYEDDTVEIQDSESDLEILPSPPSPKPDIQVEPINSMKTIVDTSYVSNKKWLEDLVENHRKQIEERSWNINHLKETSKSLNNINKDLYVGTLTRKINECLSIKDVILPTEEPETELPPLTAEQYKLVDKAFKGNPNEILIKKFSQCISRKDILTLAGLNWLNDEVINFYMNLIMERNTEGKGRLPKVYCFNTFFYPKLLRDGPESLRRWTRRIDIFSMDIICVPIHLGVHWCMSIIDFRNRSIKYYDSMGSTNQKCLNMLRNYLQSEHMDKKKSSYDTSDYQLVSVKDIPQQMNGSDCGMFSCTFAEFYSRDARFTFKQEDMPYLRSKMVVEIISGELLIK